MNAKERIQKLQQLKRRKAEGVKLNREELFKEHRHQAIGEAKLRQLGKRQENALEELEKLESEERGEDHERKKAWDYTLEDHEKWDEKVEMRRNNKKNSGFQNYTQMAEQSYKKEVALMPVDKDSYKKQKEKNGDVDFANKPTKAAVDALVESLTTGDKRRMRKKRDNDETEGYINDKNKQFNEKLSRHYDKYLK